ncbi:glycosyltransferase family 2 protein [Dermatophilus congolensis]|uniref:glycosyltransferase family 2 protein n=1 Tax=Dermatophilus congolensis TaxID=1863 RepID=UPI001AAE5CAE|nr:glycosyltransferase family 2 protein [Dermatophilus congolensis]MBO3143370.1 glycosyltransferase family 2 protein [Dermatophilus congolensis]MBO3152359.1 glycosyltransferase family 2 protein [Dermatophilus congolensis]MBO3160630.1 glycosyltransferase family 2 protein [Dermatophilus congolensis]MBO3163647.1 glycosyltransferase family 2 protein [Dermatophilus congolensis]MBO3177193.1 glycosyltransferase family 2 protein [Dermatophilus congolensis]
MSNQNPTHSTPPVDALGQFAPEESWPPVTVMIPVLDEENHLDAAVRQVLAQDYPGEVEVILAVGPSKDRTAEVAAALAAADERVTVVENPSGRTPDALNAAIAASHHPIIVRVDGHAELSEGYIRLAVAELLRVGADNVGGIMNAQGRTTFEKAVACAMRSKIGVGNARFHVGGEAGPADTVYLGVFRRRALEKAGGYDPHFTRAQDWELNHRIRQAGGTVWFTPALSVTYRPRGSFSALATQYRNYGRWRRVVAATHEGTINLRYLAPPAMVLGTVAATVLGTVWHPAWIVPAGYLAGITAGALSTSRGEPLKVRATLPAVLATMHWSWGIGFITSPKELREVSPTHNEEGATATTLDQR